MRLATGPAGGGFLPLGEQLASALNGSMSTVEITVLPTAGAVANINAIQQGKAELGFTFADVGYLAFSGQLTDGGPPFDQLRGIAVLQVTPIALVAREGLSIRDPGDLRGLRVGVGPPGSGTAVTAGLILQAFGLDEKDLRVEEIGFQEAATKLLDGRLDAMFNNAITPSESLKRVTDAGARFVPIEGPSADRLRRDYPFLTATVTSRELHGSSVHTIGVDGVLICRSDLDETLAYELTKQLMLSLKSLGRGPLRGMDVDQAPATPVPLHPGAARYYRERELSR
jgi:TRAP transporter TAXI family solute receptor